MNSTSNRQRVLITGAAGLVGQNLIPKLADDPELELLAVDKHPANTKILKKLHPDVEVIQSDLSQCGAWENSLGHIDVLVILHAQIGGLDEHAFEANNVEATRNILDAAKAAGVQYIVHVSSSVVFSKADDYYTRSKKAQELLVTQCGIPQIILRPTLMFGWFDRKHFGWLKRFMHAAPIFPIPGHGRYLRQPLYAGDFSAIIKACISNRPEGSYNISGLEKTYYIDLVRKIKQVTSARALIVSIPFKLFYGLLSIYALFDKNPPFTTNQLKALVIPETFETIDWPSRFNVQATPLQRALELTFKDPVYSEIVLEY
ncbi:MAG: NAD-dependent epimerase/dehydratase family protein [Granulosicoccus sp.]